MVETQEGEGQAAGEPPPSGVVAQQGWAAEWGRFLWPWGVLALVVPLVVVWLELWALRAADVVELNWLPLFALGLVALGQVGPLALVAIRVQGPTQVRQEPALFKLGLVWLVALALGILGLLYRVNIPAFVVGLVVVIVAVAAVWYLKRR